MGELSNRDIRLAAVHISHEVPEGSEPQRFVCVSCRRSLPENRFALIGERARRSHLGRIFILYPQCIGCSQLRRSALSKHPLWTPKLHRWVQFLLGSARTGARPRGLIFALSDDDLLEVFFAQNGRCALTGMEMAFEHGSKALPRSNRRSMSLDRIDPKGNYTRDNIQLVCWAINSMKADMTEDEFRFWCAKVILAGEDC